MIAVPRTTDASYYRARYYDPATGRFLNEGPIRFVGGPNYYRYVRNKPTVFRDPLGLCPVSDCKTRAIEGAIGGIALDAIGLVPGGEAAATAISDGGVLLQGFDFAAGLGSVSLTASEGDGTGAALAVTSTTISIVQIAKGATGLVPVVGQVVAGVSILWDIYHGIVEYKVVSRVFRTFLEA
jgi:uncharacterized protein RhaS with RHS repeats